MVMTGCVGVDGCRAGWFAVCLQGAGAWHIEVFADIETAWTQLHAAELILIDIPIGLCDSGTEGRQCDREARRLLGQPRATSVFTPPARPALACATREQAAQINFTLTGKKIGVQSWGIAPKIREVDRFMQTHPDARLKLRESHPEVVLWAFNGSKAIAETKKSRAGFEARLQLLSHQFPKATAIVDSALSRFPRTAVARDDILDALALAVTAYQKKGRLQTLPPSPPTDTVGLPMEIVY